MSGNVSHAGGGAFTTTRYRVTPRACRRASPVVVAKSVRVCSTPQGPRCRSSRSLALSWIGRILLVLLALCALVLFVLYRIQRRLYYSPKAPRRGPTPANVGLRHWNVRIDNRIDAWWVPAAPGHATALICHGNAGNMSHRLPLLATIRKTGMGALIFDYSGYGNTPGKPSEAALRTDALAVWKWLKKRVGARNVVFIGRSLGGGVACDLAHQCLLRVSGLGAHKDARQNGSPPTVTFSRGSHAVCELPRALILDSTFTSMPDACVDNLPRAMRPAGPLFRCLVQDRYSTVAKLEQVAAAVPTVILHTVKDRVVPFAHAARNAEVAGCPLVVLPRGGHNDGYMRSSGTYQSVLTAMSAVE